MSSSADAPLSATPPGVVTLRPETPEDEAFRLALFRASRGPGWNQIALPPDMLTTIMTQQFLAQTQGYRADYPDARLEIIMVDGIDVGRMATDRRADALHLIDIAMTPPWRGRGVGAAILRGLMDEAQAQGLPLTLQVARDNFAAQRLYHRLAFVATAANETHFTLIWRPSTAGAI